MNFGHPLLCVCVSDMKALTVMHKLTTAKKTSLGASTTVALLVWYNLGQELLLVLEKLVPAENHLMYKGNKGGSLEEEALVSCLGY